MVQLEPRSRELQISRVDNPSSSPATDLVTLSPQHLSTIDVIPLETAEVSLSSSSSSPADEIFLWTKTFFFPFFFLYFFFYSNINLFERIFQFYF
jgi:hypothetical protein